MLRLSHQLFIILLFCLVGCGYQLQKPLVISDHRQAIFIDGDRSLALKLKKQLRSQGINVSDSLSNASSRITLAVIERNSRNLTLSADSRDAQTAHRLSVSIEWLSLRKHDISLQPISTSVILSTTSVHAELVQLQNPDNVAAQQSTKERIQQQLGDRIIAKILHIIRLNSR
jgi:outer membrane lipopolysaccharide assembly protein LptE/RlpB